MRWRRYRRSMRRLLVEMATRSLTVSADSAEPCGERFHVIVHTDASHEEATVEGRLGDRVRISAETSRRLMTITMDLYTMSKQSSERIRSSATKTERRSPTRCPSHNHQRSCPIHGTCPCRKVAASTTTATRSRCSTRREAEMPVRSMRSTQALPPNVERSEGAARAVLFSKPVRECGRRRNEVADEANGRGPLEADAPLKAAAFF